MMVNSIDGCVEGIGELVETGCCPPDICEIDLHCLVCSFVQQLPNGPAWDYWKQKFFEGPRVNILCDAYATEAATCETKVYSHTFPIVEYTKIYDNGNSYYKIEYDFATQQEALDFYNLMLLANTTYHRTVFHGGYYHDGQIAYVVIDGNTVRVDWAFSGQTSEPDELVSPCVDPVPLIDYDATNSNADAFFAGLLIGEGVVSLDLQIDITSYKAVGIESNTVYEINGGYFDTEFNEYQLTGELIDCCYCTCFNGDVSVQDCPYVVYPSECISLVNHAVYTASRLHYLLKNAAQFAIDESSAYNAYNTLPDWLDRLGWRDCFGEECREPTLGRTTAVEYEIPPSEWPIITDNCGNVIKLPPCGPERCEYTMPDDLMRTIQHGIVAALARLNMGIVNNLCSINFVLQELGAEVVPHYCCDMHKSIELAELNNEFSCELIPPVPESDCNFYPAECCEPGFEIRPVSNYIKPHKERCGCSCADVIEAFVEVDCGGETKKIFPGILAAECIFRSLNNFCPIDIKSTHEVIYG